MKKRGLMIILSVLLLSIVIGCGTKSPEVPAQQVPVESLTSEETRAFVHSLPNIRDAISSTFGSLNIYFSDFMNEFNAKKVMIAPSEDTAEEIKRKASLVQDTLDNINLINTDFNQKKAGANLRGSDANLAEDISDKLIVYQNNKAKFANCADSMKKYARFIELTAEREDLIQQFTINMEKAGAEIEEENYEEAISIGKTAKSNVQRLKTIDLERSKMGIVSISSDVLMSWDLHVEAMDILLSLWNDLKADRMNDAMDKAQEHYNTFSRANKYGEKEPPVSDQANSANVWLSSNIGSCQKLV
ncbi:hypothetical protein GF358_04025 [Candidatus Woesearchaeota archaeon]|nr:hypothetical protein [Candidatus Woesearchaeota archaeon]